MRRFCVSGLVIVASYLLSLPASAQPIPNGLVNSHSAGGLMRANGVSGLEAEVREAIRTGLPAAAKVRVDEIGNLIATFGQGSPHVLICADMDEDGYFVSAITDDGYLRVHRVTTGVQNRLFEQMHYGQPMSVRTQAGKHVPGVFATASTHLQRGRDQSPAPKGLDDLWVDVGASNRTEVERLGIRMLDPVGLRERVHPLTTTRFAGVAAQTRAIDGALAEVASRLDVKSLTGTLTIAWTTQGSFGERGMARLARQLEPDRVVVVTRTAFARDGVAGNAKGAVGQLGAGVLVADSDAATIDLAKQNGLAVQPVAGLRAPSVWPAGKTQAISVPVLYAQTPVECVDARDVDALTRMLGLSAGARMVTGGVVSGPIGDRAPARTLTDTLRLLIAATGVSGSEGPVRDVVLKNLPRWAKPQVDDHGNVTVAFGGGGKDLLFVAHVDEIGYAITDIREDGTASVTKRGGFFDYLWEAHPVFVQTAKGAVPAIVAPRPGYLTAATAAPKAEEIVLYFGTNSRAETEALGVTKGDTATIRKELTQLAGSRWTARSMDDRCGVAALIEALRQIDPAKVPNRVTFAFVTGEETGLVGSGFLAERLHPAYTFAIDTFVSSDSPVDPQRMALVPLGSGVVARAVDNSVITPPETVARVIAIGQAHKIPVIPSATSGGNDGSRFTPYGSIVMPLSWPGRYSHSPAEVMDLRDLEHLVRLVTALAQDM